jgi:hypothetical protein
MAVKYQWQLGTDVHKNAKRKSTSPSSVMVTFREFVPEYGLDSKVAWNLGIEYPEDSLDPEDAKAIYEAILQVVAKLGGTSPHMSLSERFTSSRGTYVNVICGRVDFPKETPTATLRKHESAIRKAVQEVLKARGAPFYEENL